MSELTVPPAIECNICSANDYDVVYEAGVAQVARIVRCQSCDLMYANPRGQAADCEDYQQWEPEGLLKGLREDPKHPYRWRYLKEILQVRDFDVTRKLLKQLYPSPGSIVEVGSGLGYLLRSFRDEGWDVLGVDPWRELTLYTSEEHGFETLPMTLEQAKLPDNSADVMIMLHVIEHVPDPVSTMREIHRILKPGGHLVLETPRYDTVAFRLMGRRERSLRQDGHIYFFTDDTLRKTYEKAGFRETNTRHVGRSLTAERFIWNVANVFRSERASNLASRISRGLRLDRLRFTLNLRDMVRVVVQKV